MASNDNQPKHESPLCEEHNLKYTDICLAENCPKRWLCHICKLRHPENHLRGIFSLPEFQSGEFLSHIDNIITNKQKTLAANTEDKKALVKQVNTMFSDLQEEIERTLIETKTEIIHSIEKLYQDLTVDYSEEYFLEIKKSLFTLGEEIKKQEVARISTSIEHFSSIYSQTMNSLNYGLHLTTKFNEKNLQCQDLLEYVKHSCRSLLERTCDEIQDNQIQKLMWKEVVKAAPQEITCMEHCSDLGLVATGGSHGLLTLWNDKTFVPVLQLQLHDSFISHSSYLLSTQTLITTSKDNTIRMTKLSADGTIANFKRINTHKMIRYLVPIQNETQLATISNQGNKVRIWNIQNQDLVYVDGINVAIASHTTKLFEIPKDELLGVTYEDSIKLYSMQKGTIVQNLTFNATFVSFCFVQESQTLHAITSSQQQNKTKYEENIWKQSANGEYAIWNTREIEKTEVYGKPLEILANSSVVATIFNNGFTLSKIDGRDETLRFIIYHAQTSSTENQKPALIAKNDIKLVIPGDMKKFKIYNLS